jgi:CubicO group peptidase (beta-lactamase class C family)
MRGAVPSEAFARVCSAVEAAMGRHAVPGTALGVLHRGEVEVAGFGATSVEHPQPVDADTLFAVGSYTKTFTGAAVLRLVETGELDLDVPLRTCVAGLRLADPDAAARATLRHALQHTGGWVGDFAPDTGRGDDALARLVARMAENSQLTRRARVTPSVRASAGRLACSADASMRRHSAASTTGLLYALGPCPSSPGGSTPGGRSAFSKR